MLWAIYSVDWRLAAFLVGLALAFVGLIAIDDQQGGGG